jgi:alkylation response protein AidB-like acyl-CoA dehydrogenase
MSDPAGHETDRLRESARAWIPVLVSRADEIESARQLPDDIAQQLAGEGFYRMWVTRQLGGLEFPLVPTLEILESLAEGDPSVAWCVAIGITSSLSLTALPETSAKEVFAKPETIFAGVFAPTGRADALSDTLTAETDSGFQVTGQWSFGSGAPNADWVLAGCRFFKDGEPITDEHGTPRTNMVLVPSSQIESLDNWDVLGLRGTGSSDFRLTDVRVSENMVPGWFSTTRPTGSLYRIPNLTLLAVGFGAIALGLARAVLDEFKQLAATKISAMAVDPLGKRGDVQSQVARAEVQLRSARTHYYEMADAIYAAAESGKVTLDHRADLRLANCHAVDTGAEIAATAFRLAGGSSIYRGSRIERLFRDSNVITQHVQVRSENYAIIGSQLLGVPRGVGIL